MKTKNQILLPQMAIDQPAIPPAGESLLFGGPDGRLYMALSDGTRRPLTPSYATLGSNITSNTNTIIDVPDLSIAVETGTYFIRYIMGWSTNNSLTGIRVALAGPAVSSCMTTVEIWTSATSVAREVITSIDTVSTVSNSAPAATVLPLIMTTRATFTESGNVYPRFSRLTQNAATIRARSFGIAAWTP